MLLNRPGTWRSSPADVLPVGWSAVVRRTWLGTWSASGYYESPQVEQPLLVVWGTCWRRSTAIEQVRYWIEDAAANPGEWLPAPAELIFSTQFGSATDDELPGRYCGIPGLVWYSRVTKTIGDQLKVGQALDSLDHRGARTIYGIRVATPGSGFREVHFGGGWTVYSDGSSDAETIRDDVMYDVVDMDSICDPMGNPG